MREYKRLLLLSASVEASVTMRHGVVGLFSKREVKELR
jgi:hypothetical protein